MNELTLFNNPDFGSVRAVEINGEVWIAGKDVATNLKYSNPQKAIRDHVDEEDKTVNEMFTVNGTAIVLINESGLYSLVLSSKMPDAKKFRRWITSEVIPAIMRTGSYSMNGKPKKTSPITEKRLEIQAKNAEARLMKAQAEQMKVFFEFSKLLSPEAQVLAANEVGRLANAHGLKTDTYGITVLDTAPNGKQIPTFRYNQHGIDKLKELLKN
jgi:prophage antirepressor-like protein